MGDTAAAAAAESVVIALAEVWVISLGPVLHFQAVLREKLKYAIHFCKSIDTDEYARVAMPGSGGASSNCDSDELDSIASDGPGSVWMKFWGIYQGDHSYFVFWMTHCNLVGE